MEARVLFCSARVFGFADFSAEPLSSSFGTLATCSAALLRGLGQGVDEGLAVKEWELGDERDEASEV